MIARGPGSDMSMLADASALLWRLRLRSIEVGERWRLLADRWEAHAGGARPFYVVHAMMAFAASGRSAAAARALQALRHGDPGGAALSLPEEALALPLCEALVAFSHRASLRRQSRPVRPHPSHVDRGGIACTKGAARPRACGGACGTETGESAQSAAAAAFADDACCSMNGARVVGNGKGYAEQARRTR